MQSPTSLSRTTFAASQTGLSVSVSVAGSPTLKETIVTSSEPLALAPSAATRKKKLDDDPWTAEVTIHSVKCLGCGHRVRLSTKSLFDNHHWNQHKIRCKKAGKMKADDEVASSKTREILVSVHPRSRAQPRRGLKSRPRPTAKPNKKAKRASSVSSSMSSLTPTSTPPLTSDNEDEEMGSEEDTELPPRPIPVYAAPKKRDFATEQYFARAHGIQIRLPPFPGSAGDLSVTETNDFDWRKWNWDQLRMAEFVIPTSPSEGTAHYGSSSSDGPAPDPLAVTITDIDFDSRLLRSGSSHLKGNAHADPPQLPS